MRTDKTEWLYQCVVTAAMVEAILVPLFGLIVGAAYHRPSLAAPPALTEQYQRAATVHPRQSHLPAGRRPQTVPCQIPAVATAIVQEIGVTSTTCSKSGSRHWARTHLEDQRDVP